MQKFWDATEAPYLLPVCDERVVIDEKLIWEDVREGKERQGNNDCNVNLLHGFLAITAMFPARSDRGMRRKETSFSGRPSIFNQYESGYVFFTSNT